MRAHETTHMSALKSTPVTESLEIRNMESTEMSSQMRAHPWVKVRIGDESTSTVREHAI